MDPTKILSKLPEAQRAAAWDAIAQAQDGPSHRVADQLLAVALVVNHPVMHPILVELNPDAPGSAQLRPGVVEWIGGAFQRLKNFFVA